MRHTKKVWPEYFQKILDDKKTYELRLADWECNEGDILILQEWNPETKEYTGREIKKTVGTVIKTQDIPFYAQEEIDKFGFYVIQLE